MGGLACPHFTGPGAPCTVTTLFTMVSKRAKVELRSLLKTLEISEFPNKIANLNSAQSSVEGKIHDDPRAQESVPLGLNGCAVATPQTLVTAPCANRPAQGR